MGAITTLHSGALARGREQRMFMFLVVLTALTLPFLAIGVLDFPQSPWGLVRALFVLGYYAVYYWLIRRGHGVAATYACFTILTAVLAWGAHDAGGGLTVVTSLYFLLLVGAGAVLNTTRALDVTLALCLLGFAGLVAYELTIAPPLVFPEIYRSDNMLAIVSTIVSMLVALVGTHLVLRAGVVNMNRSTQALDRARDEAEQRAQENAALAAQVQESNHSLLAAQGRLRQTVEALALPVIPLNREVALLPLIGYIDEGRSENLVRGLLEAIYARRFQHVVLDITGLREIDARVGRVLVEAAQAAQLLGAEVTLSGVSAEAARVLVELDVDLSNLRTTGRLSEAIAFVGSHSDAANGQGVSVYGK